MSVMTSTTAKVLFCGVVCAALPVTAAHAQYYSNYAQPAPLYPYVLQNSQGQRTPPGYANQPYAIEVAPNTYVIKRPGAVRDYPYVRGRHVQPVAQPKHEPKHKHETKPKQKAETKAKRFDRTPKPADRGLIEELRQRHAVKKTTINTTKIVRHPPVVVETQSVVDDPPRIIERYHVAEDAPPPSRRKQAAVEERAPHKRAKNDDTKKRVIQADAEITILGPDRMSIRLFRKGQGPGSNVITD